MAGEFKAIRDAITTWLNEEDWSQDIIFESRAKLQLDAEKRAIGDLSGYVMELSKQHEPDGRETRLYRYQFLVGFIERLAGGSSRENRIDELVYLNEEIEERMFKVSPTWAERLNGITGNAVTLAPPEAFPVSPYNDEKLTSGVFDSAVPIGFMLVK